MLSDKDIIRRVRKGRVQEFRLLVERYQGSVLAIAYRILGRQEDAQDAAQNTFISVYQSLNTYSDAYPFWPWLRRITVNCSIRQLPRELPSDEIEQMLDYGQVVTDSAEIEVIRQCDLQILRKAISALPAIYRTAMVLRYQEDLSTIEIAEMLEEPVSTVRVRLHRALKILAERMAVVADEL